MPLPPQTAKSLAYSLAIAELLAKVLTFGMAAWRSTSIDDAGAVILSQRLAPVVTSAQLQVANLTAVFLARQTDTEPVRADEDVVTRARGVDPELVYQRPVIATRSELKRSVLAAEPIDLDAAREVGARRLESLVTTDLQLAKVHQARASLISAERKFYRRVPRAEGACAMCLIASTQRYKVHALMPIHPGCQCGVEVLPPGMDLDGNVIDIDLLNATHAKVKEFAGIADRGGRAPDYRKLLITREHGELGSVLAYRGYQFTGPTELQRSIAAQANRSKADIARDHLPGLEASLANLRAQGLAEGSSQISYHLTQIARLQGDLVST